MLKNTILDNMTRQRGALKVLSELLNEEFERLRAGDHASVAGLQMSIQELIRQIARERTDLKVLARAIVPGNERLDDFAAALPDGDREEIQAVMNGIDKWEQACAWQSSKNAELARALRDQSVKLMDFMHANLTPENTEVYTARGHFPKARTEATIVRGSF